MNITLNLIMPEDITPDQALQITFDMERMLETLLDVKYPELEIGDTGMGGGCRDIEINKKESKQ